MKFKVNNKQDESSFDIPPQLLKGSPDFYQIYLRTFALNSPLKQNKVDLNRPIRSGVITSQRD